MKKTIIAVLVSASAVLAHADLYNQSITAIFGSGNPNTGWADDTGNGLTLALRGKNRTTGDTTNVNGVYSFATGVVPPANNRAVWNYEFSINAGTAQLSAFDYYLGVDMDPSLGISYTYVDALNFFNDDAYGNSGTANGAGVVGTGALAGSNTIAQNSENIVFSGLNPNLNATYNYELYAVAKGAGVNGARLDDVAITVVVGSGGTAVPDSASSALLIGLGLAGVAGFKSRRRVA